jgi:membrane-associated phospholipid phosphatase
VSGAPPRRLRTLPAAVSIATAAAFTVLAVLVSEGAFATLDRYALREWMPFRSHVYRPPSSFFQTLISYSGRGFHLGEAVRLPAGALLATVLVVALAAVLWRRSRTVDALLVIGVFVIANVVETITKDAITRPFMYAPFKGKPLHLTGFDNSFPSGHALRATILAAVVVAVWPRLWPLLAAWLVVVLVTLQLDGIHAPSDIAGGLLLGISFVAAAVVLRPKMTTWLEPYVVRPASQTSRGDVDLARPPRSIRGRTTQ